MHVPQRLLVVERRAREVVEQREQRMPVARRRQRDMVEVLFDVEIGHVLPMGRSDRQSLFDHALAEAREAGRSLPVDRLDLFEVQRRAGEQDARDHAQVHRTIDVVPRRVHRRHRVRRHRIVSIQKQGIQEALAKYRRRWYRSQLRISRQRAFLPMGGVLQNRGGRL